MTYFKAAPLMGLIMLIISGEAPAYEEEDSVPLTIFAQGNNRNIKNTSITLNGREVEIKSEIHNPDNFSKRLGFIAHTPFFEQLGDGEDHIDKTFSDLTVALNAKSVNPMAYRRGFFLGQDVSTKLNNAGISPLPDSNVDEKKLTRIPKQYGIPISNWQGYVSYSWVTSLRPKSINWQTVRYRALPQFERDQISSERFRRRVVQHCGNPDVVGKYLTDVNSHSDEILVENYELPVHFLRTQEVRFEVVQPKKNWLGAQPIVSLICGLSEKTDNRLNYSGTIINSGKSISILVISKLAQLSER